MHRAGHKAENVLDTAACLRLDTVAFFLFLGQRIVAIALFVDVVLDVFRQFFSDFFRCVGAVGVEFPILFIDHLRADVAVVHRRRSRSVIQYDLALRVDLYVVFIPVMRFFPLDCPAGVHVLLRQFVRVFRPFFGRFALLDAVVFVLCVSLLRRVDKGHVNDRTLVRDDPHRFKITVEHGEKYVQSAALTQQLIEQPDRLCVRHLVSKRNAEKALKTQSVGNLVFDLIVRQIVRGHQNNDLEHHHVIERRSSGVAFPLLFQRVFQRRTERLEVYNVLLFKRISQFAQFVKLIVLGKPVQLHRFSLRSFGTPIVP